MKESACVPVYRTVSFPPAAIASSTLFSAAFLTERRISLPPLPPNRRATASFSSAARFSLTYAFFSVASSVLAMEKPFPSALLKLRIRTPSSAESTLPASTFQLASCPNSANCGSAISTGAVRTSSTQRAFMVCPQICRYPLPLMKLSKIPISSRRAVSRFFELESSSTPFTEKYRRPSSLKYILKTFS